MRNQSKKDYKIISVEVPIWLNEALTAKAKADGITKSEAMRKAFADYLAKNA